MNFRITEANEGTQNTKILVLAGSICNEAAGLLETVCTNLLEQPGVTITLDASEVIFISDNAAKVLCRLKRTKAVSLTGLQLFTRHMIEHNDQSFVTNKAIQS